MALQRALRSQAKLILSLEPLRLRKVAATQPAVLRR